MENKRINKNSGWTREETTQHLNEVLSLVKTEQEKWDVLADWQPFLPKAKGIFSKRCPDCNQALIREKVESSPIYDYKVYHCSSCSYSYVERQSRD